MVSGAGHGRNATNGWFSTGFSPLESKSTVVRRWSLAKPQAGCVCGKFGCSAARNPLLHQILLCLRSFMVAFLGLGQMEDRLKTCGHRKEPALRSGQNDEIFTELDFGQGTSLRPES